MAAMDIHQRDDLAFPQSLPEFQQLFPDNAACAAYLGRARWPDGFDCPHCGQIAEPFRIVTRPGVLECRACRRQAGLLVGTVMERSHTRLQQFDLLSNRAATTIRAARAAWHYIFGFGGGSGGRGVADGRRERDTGRAQGQAGGGARGGADEKAFAVVFDLGLGQGIQIGDDLRP